MGTKSRIKMNTLEIGALTTLCLSVLIQLELPHWSLLYTSNWNTGTMDNPTYFSHFPSWTRIPQTPRSPPCFRSIVDHRVPISWYCFSGMMVLNRAWYLSYLIRFVVGGASGHPLFESINSSHTFPPSSPNAHSICILRHWRIGA